MYNIPNAEDARKKVNNARMKSEGICIHQEANSNKIDIKNINCPISDEITEKTELTQNQLLLIEISKGIQKAVDESKDYYTFYGSMPKDVADVLKKKGYRLMPANNPTYAIYIDW